MVLGPSPKCVNRPGRLVDAALGGNLHGDRARRGISGALYPQSALAGPKARLRVVAYGASTPRAVLTVRSRAMRARESGQVRKEAALSGGEQVPRISLTRASHGGHARRPPSRTSPHGHFSSNLSRPRLGGRVRLVDELAGGKRLRARVALGRLHLDHDPVARGDVGEIGGAVTVHVADRDLGGAEVEAHGRADQASVLDVLVAVGDVDRRRVGVGALEDVGDALRARGRSRAPPGFSSCGFAPASGAVIIAIAATAPAAFGSESHASPHRR